MRIGYVGLGNLGGALAAALVRAGFAVVVHDRRPEAVARLVALGAEPATSVSDLAARVDHLYTCLPNPGASEAVLAEALIALPPGASWVENSTLGRDDVLRMADLARDAGVRMLEATVTGGVHRAAKADMTVMVGGEAKLFALHQPALRAFGSRIFHMGPLGTASLTKVITNMLAFIHLVAEGEALMLARRGGLDLRTVWQAIGASSGASFVHETEAQLILNGSYDVGFSMDLALKDLGFVMGFGREYGVPLDLAAQVQQTFLRGRAAYGGSAQSTRIVQLLEDLLGTDLRAEGFPARLGPDGGA